MPSLLVFFSLFLLLFLVSAFRFVGLLAPSPAQVWLYDYVEFLVLILPVAYLAFYGGRWFLRKLQKYKRIS